jgi:hypothetical protein
MLAIPRYYVGSAIIGMIQSGELLWRAEDHMSEVIVCYMKEDALRKRIDGTRISIKRALGPNSSPPEAKWQTGSGKETRQVGARPERDDHSQWCPVEEMLEERTVPGEDLRAFLWIGCVSFAARERMKADPAVRIFVAQAMGHPRSSRK